MQDVKHNHIPAIIEIINNMILRDGNRNCSSAFKVKILVILQLYGIPFMSSGNFFTDHTDLGKIRVLKKQTSEL